jgi:hypothetical protein
MTAGQVQENGRKETRDDQAHGMIEKRSWRGRVAFRRDLFFLLLPQN